MKFISPLISLHASLPVREVLRFSFESFKIEDNIAFT